MNHKHSFICDQRNMLNKV